MTTASKDTADTGNEDWGRNAHGPSYGTTRALAWRAA
jgi:hypothetical protein